MEVELPEGTRIDKAKKFSSCWTWGQKIQFDPTRKSKSGRLIPLNEDGSPHDCPNRNRSFGSTQLVNRQRQFAADSFELTPYVATLMQEHKELKNEVCPGFEDIRQTLNRLQHDSAKAADTREAMAR